VARPEGFSDMMESQLNQLIVSEPLLDAVRSGGWERFAVDELPVLEKPRDGLPKDPADWPPPRISPREERYRRILESERRAKTARKAEGRS